MTYYKISQCDMPVAIVSSLDLAREIARCQPPGYYRIDELEVDPPHTAGRRAVRKRTIRSARARKPGTSSGRKVVSRRGDAPRQKPRS
jgi:hypothetical protein